MSTSIRNTNIDRRPINHEQEPGDAADHRNRRVPERLRAVAAAASGVIGAGSRQALRRILEDACREVIQFDAFFVQLYDAESHTFHGFGGRDAGHITRQTVVSADGTPGERVVRERKSLLTLRSDDPASQGAHLTGTGRRSESVIRSPILSEGTVLGILSVHSYTPESYGEEDVQVVETIASLAAIALENLRLTDERVAAAEALQERERQLWEAQRIAQLGSWRWTLASGRLQWSEEMFHIYGLTSSGGDITFAQFVDRLHPDDRHALMEQINEARRTGQSYEVLHRIIRPDGEVRTLLARGEVSLEADGTPREMFGTGQDVTERMEAEAALQRAHDELEQRIDERTAELEQRSSELERAEQRFRAIVDASPTPLLISSVVDGTVLYANDRLEALIGAPAGTLLQKKTPDFYFDPAERPTVIEAVRTHGYLRDHELRIKRYDGTPRWVSLSVQRLDFDGQPAVATALIDMTERKEAESTLRLQKTLLEAQGEASIDGILVVSEEGKIVSFNQRFVEMWEIPDEVIASRSDEAAIQTVLDRVADPQAFQVRINHLYEHPNEKARDDIVLRDGRVFDRYSAPVISSRKDYYGRIWFFRDVTASKRHEEELEKARREADGARVRASRYAKSLERELEFGRKIQQGLLPAALPAAPGWEIAVRFRPVWQVAGDFYDAFELPSGHIGLIIADVSGKGVGAALFMALFQSLLRASAERAGQTNGREPATDEAILSEAVAATNSYIMRVHRHAHMFASVFFGLLDPKTGVINYINAGHERPVIVDSGGERKRLETTGPALGLLSDTAFGVEHTVLAPGELLVAFTDGVTEARSDMREFFTEERLLALLDSPVTSASHLLDRIERAVREFSNEAAPSDDLTLLAVRRGNA
jgi:sigma-B regulation protein RsbU (phosphoserine phosphatase)